MASHGARQQKKLAKKKSQREQKRKHLAVLQSPGMAQLAVLAKRGVIAETAVSRELFENGLGYAWINRKLPDGRVAFACFLLDVWCLGVKDLTFDVNSAGEVARMYRQLGASMPWRSIAPPDLRNLVLQSVDYARSLGLEPHPDYRHAQAMLADIEGEGREQFVFGKDGKPFFVSGPDDGEYKCKMIIEKMNAVGGHFMMRLPNDLDEDEFDFEGEDADFAEEMVEDESPPRLIA